MKTSRILIADDREENRYLLHALLQGHGYEVVTARHGVEALELARQNPPDLIITDILMPVMDGFALCREWKQDEQLKAIPFIFYTATYTDERDRKFALSLGAEQFIIKPEEPDVLIAIIREIIRQIESPSAAQAEPAADTPTRPRVTEPTEEESGFLKQYNETLIRKLEVKMEQLEQANRELEQDITERKQAEDALRQERELLRTLIDNMPDFIYAKDVAGRFTVANLAVARAMGVDTPDAILGKTDFDFYSPEAAAQYRANEEQLITSGQTLVDRGEQVTDISGTPRWISTSKVLLRNSAGEVVGLVGIGHDITDRLQLEAQFRQAQKMEAVGRLAGGVAHDFNNLLTAIMGYAELLLDKPELDDAVREDLGQIMRAAVQASSLTRQLLIFSRKQALQPQVLDLNEIVASMDKMLRRLIGEDIILETRLEPGLGYVRADPGQISQVIVNLAVNARDAMPDGGTLIIATAATELDANYAKRYPNLQPGIYAMLALTDTGTGMDTKTLEHAFEPFFTTKEHGTGLGLATVYGIVTQSGGHVHIYSELGVGTAVKAYLPVVTAQGAVMAAPELEAVGGSETILVVEDNEALRILACRALREGGYKVLEASDVSDAIRIVDEQEGNIHLVLSDVIMPEMNGPQLMERLRERCPKLKVLFMSGYTDNLVVIASSRNPDAYLQKPFTPPALLRKVRSVLESLGT